MEKFIDSLPESASFSKEDEKFMQQAIQISIDNIANGGGPFGAVIVKNGEVVASGANRVVPDNDPTAHAEVSAIRQACKNLGTFNLEGCTIYSSCEPCPMCLSAIYWSRISRLCYGNTKRDAAEINFDDSFIYDQLHLNYDERSLKCEHFLRNQALAAFHLWAEKEDKTEY